MSEKSTQHARRAATATAKASAKAAGSFLVANPVVAAVIGALVLLMLAVTMAPILLTLNSSATDSVINSNRTGISQETMTAQGIPAEALTDIQQAASDKGLPWTVLASVARASNTSLGDDHTENAKKLSELADQVRVGVDKTPELDVSLSIASGGQVDEAGKVTWADADGHTKQVVEPWAKALGRSKVHGASEPWGTSVIEQAVEWELGRPSSMCVNPVASAAVGTDPGDVSVADPAATATLKKVVPNGKLVVKAVQAKYPSIKTIYGVRTGNDPQDHGDGHAVDIMIDNYKQPAQKQLGSEVAEYLKANADKLGITYIIWAQKIWSVQRSGEGWRSMEDRGGDTANHFDHVHVSVGDDPSPGVTGAGSATSSSAPAASAAPSTSASAPATTTAPVKNQGAVTITSSTGQTLVLTEVELRNVAVFMKVIDDNQAKFGSPEAVNKARVATVITTLVETNGKNLASNAVPESLSYPHDGVAPGDHDSVGLFQQRALQGYWGSVKQIMDPVYSVSMFLGLNPAGAPAGHAPGLLQIDGWQALEVGQLAQKVQVSAFPDRYQTWAGSAADVIKAASGIDVGSLGDSAGACTPGGGDATALVAGTAAGAGTDTYLAAFRAAGGGPGADIGVDPWSFYWGECTSYSAWMVRTTSKYKDFVNNWRNGSHFGNGGEWPQGARQAGIKVDQTPAVGAIASRTTGRYGHVAYITAVHPDGSFDVSEYNHAGHHIFGVRKGMKMGDGNFTDILHFEQ